VSAGAGRDIDTEYGGQLRPPDAKKLRCGADTGILQADAVLRRLRALIAPEHFAQIAGARPARERAELDRANERRNASPARYDVSPVRGANRRLFVREAVAFY